MNEGTGTFIDPHTSLGSLRLQNSCHLFLEPPVLTPFSTWCRPSLAANKLLLARNMSWLLASNALILASNGSHLIAVLALVSIVFLLAILAWWWWQWWWWQWWWQKHGIWNSPSTPAQQLTFICLWYHYHQQQHLIAQRSSYCHYHHHHYHPSSKAFINTITICMDMGTTTHQDRHHRLVSN